VPPGPSLGTALFRRVAPGYDGWPRSCSNHWGSPGRPARHRCRFLATYVGQFASELRILAGHPEFSRGYGRGDGMSEDVLRVPTRSDGQAEGRLSAELKCVVIACTVDCCHTHTFSPAVSA
jgi:hypothetical protein